MPDTYWDKCPDTPVFDRNLYFVNRASGSATPEAAVRAISQASLVQVRTTGPASVEVEVRLADESGVFFVERRKQSWFVKGGEGCAAWPSGELLIE